MPVDIVESTFDSTDDDLSLDAADRPDGYPTGARQRDRAGLYEVLGEGDFDPDPVVAREAAETRVYSDAMRTVPLLTREEESALGQAIRDSRLQMTHALSQVPAASRVLTRQLAEVESGERSLTDVFFSPLSAGDPNAADAESSSTDGGPTPSRLAWRKSGAVLVRCYAAWSGETDSAQRPMLAPALARAFRRLEPGFVVLSAALEECERLDARVRAIEGEHGAFHADLLAGEPGGDADTPRAQGARDGLRRLEAEAGVDLTTLRTASRNAAAAYRAYQRARSRMVEANLRLAHHMAHKLVGNGVAYEDLVQEAMLGLMRAVDKFDHRLGYKFSTYACQWIRQATTRAIADASRTVRVAAHMHDNIVRLRRTARELRQARGRDATPADLAEASGLTPAQVRQVLETARAPASLDAPVPGSEGLTLQGCLEDRAGIDPSDGSNDARVAERIADVLDTLPPREAFILRMRYGIGTREPHKLEDIGAVLGITRERTRQIEMRALSRLREQLSPIQWSGE